MHFLHMSGPFHAYKWCLAYFICCGWSYGCHSILYGHCHNWAVCHILRELTTLLGCDWYLLSTSYTYQAHFIHINGVLNTLYAVDGHTDTTPTCTTMVRAKVKPCFTSVNQPHCSVVIGTSYPLHTHARSTSYI